MGMAARDVSLGDRLEAQGRRLGAREAEHAAALERARERAAALHVRVSEAIERFHAGVAETEARYLHIGISAIRVDDKHVRAVEFELSRGRHKAIVIAKARGEVTLVGPFHAGKAEGPCRSFPFEAERDVEEALATFLERFVEAAATP